MGLEINELDIFLGKKIRSFRTKMKWGLKTLSFNLGISVPQLQKYEMGINKVSSSLLYEMSKVFGVPIKCFFEGFGEEDESDNSESKSSFNILLIEDNIREEFMLRKALEDFPAKLNLYSINQGDQALRFLKEYSNDCDAEYMIRPDIIFLELRMASIPGLDILKNIRTDKNLSSIPVVILSNIATEEEIAVSYSLQASGFIQKSFSYSEFKEKLHSALSYWVNTVILP